MTLDPGDAQNTGDKASFDDHTLLALARGRDEHAIRILVRRHNRRLFRAARAIVRDDAEAEDVVQAAYVRAFTYLDGFRGDAHLSTWLTRIALNEALGRVRAQRPTTGIEQIDRDSERHGRPPLSVLLIQIPMDPEAEMSRHEIRVLLERAVDELPTAFRTVFVLRDIEGMSVEETALQLAIRPETVRTRLHRARRLLRLAIEDQISGAFTSLFPFDGARCNGMADKVLRQLGQGRASA